MASIAASDSPVRTRSDDARAPSSSPTASTRMDLPAPVSPVRTLRPASNSTSTASMTARWETLRKRSMEKRENSNRSIGLTAVLRHATVLHLVRGTPTSVGAVPAAHLQERPEGCLRTLGSPLAALLLQAQGGVPPEGSGTSILELITRSPLTLSVLFLLGMISIVSWGIIFYKLWVYRRSQRQTVQFIEVFRRSNKFSEVQAVCRSLSDSPLVGLFQAGYAELTAQLLSLIHI